MKLFRESKGQPIKLTNFKYIDYSKNYPNIVYYYKELPKDNFELMTCSLEGTNRKPEIGAGTNVKVIDTFMANYLYNLRNDIKPIDTHDFITKAVETSFNNLRDTEKEAMIKHYNAAIPDEIKKFESYKKAQKEDFKILYCSNDESKDRLYGVVNLIMVKNKTVESKQFEIKEEYTMFRYFKFLTTSKFIKGKSGDKYILSDEGDIIVNNNLLI